jgi:hypothetical protein
MWRCAFFLFAIICALVIGALLLREYWPPAARFFPHPRLTRPHGMAPVSFNAFLRACSKARVHPHRIGQTIGDHPLSVGYHKPDGIITFRGQKIAYTAAVDIGTSDLNRAQLARFLESLAAQGFAAFYRENGKWRGNEHIHAIYAPLRMKPQLQLQVRQWETARRRARKPIYRWQQRYHLNWRSR